MKREQGECREGEGGSREAPRRGGRRDGGGDPTAARRCGRHTETASTVATREGVGRVGARLLMALAVYCRLK